jgi:hypothetical protein
VSACVSVYELASPSEYVLGYGLECWLESPLGCSSEYVSEYVWASVSAYLWAFQ